MPDVAPDALVAEATSCSLRTGTGTARGDVTGPALVAERTEVTPDAGPRFSVVVGREINQTVLNRLAGTTGRERTPQVALACPGGTGAEPADPATSQVLRGLAAAGGGGAGRRLDGVDAAAGAHRGPGLRGGRRAAGAHDEHHPAARAGAAAAGARPRRLAGAAAGVVAHPAGAGADRGGGAGGPRRPQHPAAESGARRAWPGCPGRST
nr:hypothetical protein [Angustibacter aerolatus]